MFENLLRLVTVGALVAWAWLSPAPPARLRAADEDAGTVQGTVTLKGEPLAEGKVSFHPDKGKPVKADVKDGKFTAKDVPAGRHKLAVEGKGVPAQYSSPDRTPLLVEVKPGDNTLDVQRT
jgi:hypothetical protein